MRLVDYPLAVAGRAFDLIRIDMPGVVGRGVRGCVECVRGGRAGVGTGLGGSEVVGNVDMGEPAMGEGERWGSGAHLPIEDFVAHALVAVAVPVHLEARRMRVGVI